MLATIVARSIQVRFFVIAMLVVLLAGGAAAARYLLIMQARMQTRRTLP